MPHLSKIPFHPLLFALFPTITLYANNIHEVPGSVIWRPLLISLAGALLFLVLLRLLLRDWLKAALITSLLLLLFFTYGRIYDYLKTTPLAPLNIIRNRYLAVIFAFMMGLFCWMAIKYIRDFKPITAVLNVTAVVLLSIPVYQIAYYSINTSSREKAISSWTPATGLISTSQSKDKPDVYYIILDSYARSDLLKAELGFDNSDFIQRLQNMGFFIANCSRSNYNNTYNSLASSLNMSYLPELYTEAAKQGISKENVWMLIKPSVVRRNFESLGYKIVTFDTGYKWTTIDDSDLYLARGLDAFGVQFTSPFEQMLMDSSALSIYNDFRRQINRDKFFSAANSNANYTGQQEFILYQLPKVAEITDPTFTFAHINIPHRPYIFSTNGYLYDPALISAKDPENVKFPTGYLYAIEFINAQMLSIIQEILNNSSTPPIIILQGDHGFKIEPLYNSPILNAYFLPGIQSGKLYPSISPVNNFRLIFNEYFNGQFELLSDDSFYMNDVTKPIPEFLPDCLH
jgi:hypothetical protein